MQNYWPCSSNNDKYTNVGMGEDTPQNAGPGDEAGKYTYINYVWACSIQHHEIS